MKSVDEQIKEYKKSLEKINQELKVLEMEKEEILKAYANADEKQRKAIAKEMQASEQRFKDLCDETIALSAKVKKLKATKK